MSTITTGSLWFYPSLKKEIEKAAKKEGVTQTALVNVIVSMALSDEKQVKRAAYLIKNLEVKWPS